MEKIRRSENCSTLLTDEKFNWECEMRILHGGTALMFYIQVL